MINNIRSVKKVPGIDHSKSPLKEMVKNLFHAKLAFFFFPKLKLPLRGTHFQSIEDIKENSQQELKSIPENAFEKCFDDWIICWYKYIISRGAYFKGDKINLDE